MEFPKVGGITETADDGRSVFARLMDAARGPNAHLEAQRQLDMLSFLETKWNETQDPDLKARIEDAQAALKTPGTTGEDDEDAD